MEIENIMRSVYPGPSDVVYEQPVCHNINMTNRKFYFNAKDVLVELLNLETELNAKRPGTNC